MATLDQWQGLIDQPAPRTLPEGIARWLAASARRWRLTTIGAVLACALGFMVLFPAALVTTLELDLRASETRGVVVGSRFSRVAVGEHAFMRKTRVYSVEFQFVDANGLRYSASALTTRRMQVGERVDVEYLPEWPEAARFMGAFLVPGSYWAGLWALMFPALALFGIWNFRRTQHKKRALLIHGEVAPGIVEQVWKDGAPDRNNGWVAVRFMAGARPMQITHTTDGDGLKHAHRALRFDNYVTVIYDKRVPRECVVIELLGGG